MPRPLSRLPESDVQKLQTAIQNHVYPKYTVLKLTQKKHRLAQLMTLLTTYLNKPTVQITLQTQLKILNKPTVQIT